MSSSKHASPEHQQFYADIKAVMDKHQAVSTGFLLAHVPDRGVLGDVPAAEDDCLVWAIDPQTNERYCVTYRNR